MKYCRLLTPPLLLCVSILVCRVVQAENSLTVGNGFAARQQVTEVPLLISADRTFHGFIMVFDWDETLGAGEDLIPRDGPEEVLGEADIVVARVESSFMVFGVSVDADNTDCEFIPAGQNVEVGLARIRCLGGGAQRQETPIRLVDGKYAIEDGLPLLDNLLLFFGRFVTQKDGGLVFHDGTLVCAEEPPQPGSTAFACGGLLGPDGQPMDVEASRGERAQVNYYYRAPGEGFGDQRDQIQGFSMAVTHSCDLLPVDDSFSITGGVLEEVAAEFINIDFDKADESVDGDGCEFILGVLVDAQGPFDGRTIPATDQFRRLFSLDFEVQESAPCGECIPLEFTDRVMGNGMVPVDNLVSINFESRAPEVFNCSVCVAGAPGDGVGFVRGDCNFSGTTDGRPVDIADAAAAVGFFFLEGDQSFPAPCEDACDANDDGQLDVSDVVFILEYLFIAGSPEPPPPGPLQRGVDPTPDDLTCMGGFEGCI